MAEHAEHDGWGISRLSRFVVECGGIEHVVLAVDHAEALRRIATMLHFGESMFVLMCRRAEWRAHGHGRPKRPRPWEPLDQAMVQLFEFAS